MSALEIVSRIYFAVPLEERRELDIKIIDFINQKESFWIEDTDVLIRVIKRMFFAKNNEESRIICANT